MKHLIFALLCSLFTLNSTHALVSKCDTLWQKFNAENSLEAKYKNLMGNCDSEAKMILGSITRRASSVPYKRAKEKMFKTVDHHNGKVCSVYSDHCIATKKVPNHRKMNAEHTWPKSKGSKVKPAVSDLHHLFPCNSKVNSIRSSLPFCEVRDVDWTNGMSSMGKGGGHGNCFEPPNEHKGNVARAMMYFAVRYNKRIDTRQENFFRKWHKEDPVDQMEIDRNHDVARVQRVTNPFIDHPELVDFIKDF